MESLSGKCYACVYVDDYSIYAWVKFLQKKFKAFKVCRALFLQLQCEQNKGIVCIRSDHSCKFENSDFKDFCESKGIFHEFFAPLTPKNN